VKLGGVVFDCDGVIVYSLIENWLKTVEIYQELTGIVGLENVPAELKTPDDYISAYNKAGDYLVFWENLGVGDKVDEAVALWSELEYPDHTYVYDGIRDVVIALDNVPKGIVSSNSKKKMQRMIDKGLYDSVTVPIFDPIIGYEQVEKPKPDPEGTISCINEWDLESGVVFVVGDQDVDILAAKLAQDQLPHIKIVTIGVDGEDYGFPNKGPGFWSKQPDYWVSTPMGIINTIQKKLPGYELEGGILVKST